MKKGLLRALSAVVAISMLFCMSMVAFADVTATTSVTNYDVSSGNVTVRTEVNGVPSGEQVAFLVEKTTEENTEIIWIDQQPATGNVVTSSFTASVNVAENAKVRVGTTNLAATDINEGTVTLPSYTVTWSTQKASDAPDAFVTKSKVTAVVGDASIDTNVQSVSTKDIVTFYVMCAPGEKLVSINGVAAAIVGGAISYKVGETKVTDYKFAFGPAEATGDGKPTATLGSKDPATDTVAKASVVATATNASEFGIVVARKNYDFSKMNFSALENEPVGGVEVIKLAALGADERGRFVIVIDDTADQKKFFVAGAKYVAKVYAVKDGVPTFSDPFELN